MTKLQLTQTFTHNLNNGWRFRDERPAGSSPDTALPWLPAAVPGQVHIDLLNAGVISNPFERMVERSVQWVDDIDWVYETTFHLDNEPAQHTILAFEGLDTVADITLNEMDLAKTDNMFVAHEFPVGERLRHGPGEDGDNTLRVTFRSAHRVGAERIALWNETAPDKDRLDVNWYHWSGRSFIRKAQYAYGWDWGPELVSCGIWRPVKLIEMPVARLLDWRYDTEFGADGTAHVTFSIAVDRAPNAATTPINLTVSLPRAGNETDALDVPIPNSVTVVVPEGTGRVIASVQVTIEDAQLWWPNRHNPTGAAIHPTLYSVEFELGAPERIDFLTSKIGLRTIELIREPDADGKGESFKFRVNGHDIFVKGANWIPADSFQSRLEHDAGKLDCDDLADDRVYNLIWAACDAGCNMLRVWGGGIYESEHFYELCDEHGIMVWQDFAYACAYYPDTDVYADACRTEAIANVRRIRTHPCLALWCGNNENHMMYDTKWIPPPGRHIGEHLYHDVLPAVVAEEDPHTAYWPSSPYGGPDPQSQDYGDRHNWDVWHGVGDWTHYTEDTSRFCSEFGFASSCGLAAWDTCLEDSDRSPNSPAVRWHDKTRKGYETYLGLVNLHYPIAETLEDLVYYTQINQAAALKYGIEHYRRIKGRCWGTLFWQINDCWPVHSWAVIDSELQPKAAYYACRDFFASALLSFNRREDVVELHISNDALGPIEGKVSVALKTFCGEILAEQTFDAQVDANVSKLIGSISIESGRGMETGTYFTGTFAGVDDNEISRNILLLAEPKELALDQPNLGIEIDDHDADTLAISISASTFAGSVWLFLDPAEVLESPEFSNNFFHLEPGETRVVTMEKSLEVSTTEDLRELLRVRTLYGEE